MHCAYVSYEPSDRALAAYASSVSFGHPEQFFDGLDTQRFLSEFADDDFS